MLLLSPSSPLPIRGVLMGYLCAQHCTRHWGTAGDQRAWALSFETHWGVGPIKQITTKLWHLPERRRSMQILIWCRRKAVSVSDFLQVGCQSISPGHLWTRRANAGPPSGWTESRREPVHRAGSPEALGLGWRTGTRAKWVLDAPVTHPAFYRLVLVPDQDLTV